MANPGREDDYPDVLPEESRAEAAAESLALVAGFIPGLSGAVANVLGGWSAARKYERVREVLEGLALRLANLRSEVTEEYVRSDEFEDLLDQTLRRVATERHASKRQLYREFLVGAISKPGDYDKQLRVLRTLEELQTAHIAVLRAVIQEPDQRYTSGISGSFGETLKRRLPNVAEERIDDLMAQLNRLGILQHGGLTTMMTARGAEDMRQMVTKYGRRFIDYILVSESPARSSR